MLEKNLLDRLQFLTKIASDKEIGEIPVNLLSKDDLKFIKKGAKEVKKYNKKGEEVKDVIEIWFLLGKIAHKLQWYKEAEIIYRAVAHYNPRFPDAWYYLGLLMSWRGLDEVAWEMFNAALECAPTNWNKLDHVKILAGTPPVESTQAIKKRTRKTHLHLAFLSGRNKTDQCAICKTSLGYLPFTCFFCGRKYCTDHRLPEKHYCTGSYRVTILHEKGMSNDPLQLIQELYRIGQAAAKKQWMNVSSLDIMESDFNTLKHAFKKLLSNVFDDLPQAKNFNLWYLAGKVAHCFQFKVIAEEFYKKALNFESNIEVCENLALVLKDRCKWVEAEKSFRKIIAQDPKHTNAWMNLGKILYAQKREDEAKLAFDTALQQDPLKIQELIGDPQYRHFLPKEHSKGKQVDRSHSSGYIS